MRRRGIETVGPGARGLLLDERGRRGDAGLDLAGGIERGDARAVQLVDCALLRRPLCHRLVELRIDFTGFFHLALEHQHVAEAGENRRAQRRLVGNTDGALDIERGAAESLGLLVAALFDQNPGKPDNIIWR